MTDPRSTPPGGPSDGAVEARLHRTLVAVADREPVTPQLDALRARVDDGPTDDAGSRRGSTDGSRARRRLAGGLIAAALLAVVVAGAVVVARDRAEERLEVASSNQITESGWYLPSADSGWEVVGITGVPWAPMGGVRRDVGFSAPDRTSRLEVSEYRLAEGARDPLASLEEVERGSGATARTYGLVPNGGGAPNVVVARRGDLVLSVQGRDVDETVLRLVDGWWESEGDQIDPVPGMVRTSDVSSEQGRRGHTRVIVTVRRGSDDVRLSYALTPSGATLLPTGIDDEDLGAARGLEEDVRPRPIEGVPDQPGPAWEVGPDSEPRSTSVVSQAGADIEIADDISFAPPVPGSAPGDAGSDVEQVIRRRARFELLGALRTASPDAWADAVADVDGDPALAAPTLADVPTGDIGPGTTTTVPAEADEPPASSTTTVPPTTG